MEKEDTLKETAPNLRNLQDQDHPMTETEEEDKEEEEIEAEVDTLPETTGKVEAEAIKEEEGAVAEEAAAEEAKRATLQENQALIDNPHRTLELRLMIN